MKYKTRINECKKKLELTEQTLKRINEIISDLEDWLEEYKSDPDEHTKTKECYDFMVTMKNDSLEAKEKLSRIISEMTAHMTDQFHERLKFVNNSFNTYFCKLHGEGRVEIVMIAKENVLDSGLEIYVELPGMKINNAKLLTGRERSITVIALLMSVLSLPSVHFCLFDEIDKELDDNTLSIFLDYLNERAAYRQYILLTQNSVIIKSYNTFGIMQEQGVSIIDGEIMVDE